MDRFTKFIIISIALIFGGCKPPPIPESFIGIWVGPDGSQVVLNSDKTFVAKNLPSRVFLNPVKPEEPICGEGKWKIEGESLSGWEVWMDFYDGGKPSRRVKINIDREGSSVGLFQWVGEEGEERYEFTKR